MEERHFKVADVPAYFWKGARPSWHQRRRHRAVLRAIRALPGEILDYGCGYGDLTYAMSNTHSVQGVDVDPVRVQFAAEQYPSIPFAVCDPDRIDFPDGSFDVITSTVVIHFSHNPVGHLREIHRVLRPGGHLVVTCQNTPVVRNLIRRLFGKAPHKTDLWIPSRNDFKDILEQQSFRILQESYFYDPPTDGLWTMRAFPLTIVHQLLSLLHLRHTCGYYTLVAVRGLSPHTSAPAFPAEPQTAGDHSRSEPPR